MPLEYENKAQHRRWKSHSASTKNIAGLAQDTKPYTSRPDIKLLGVPEVPRVRDMIDVHWSLRLQATKGTAWSSKKLRQGLWLDLSQNVHWGRSATQGLGGTLCKGSCWYSYEQDCVLDGIDHMLLQGWPTETANDPSLSDAERKEIAGEGYHLGSFATCVMGFFLNPYAPWWR